MRARFFLIISCLLLLAIFSFSASSEETTQTNRVIDVEISGFKYTPDPISIKPGETVTFQVTNKDSAPHTFTVDGTTLLDLQPGKSGSVDYTAPSAEQILPITCDYHPSMSADLVVESSAATDSSTSSSEPVSTSDPTTTNSTSEPVPEDSDTTSEGTPFPSAFFLVTFITIATLRRRAQ